MIKLLITFFCYQFLALGISQIAHANNQDLNYMQSLAQRGSTEKDILQPREMSRDKNKVRALRDMNGRIYKIEGNEGKSLTLTFNPGGIDEMRSAEGHVWKLKSIKTKKGKAEAGRAASTSSNTPNPVISAFVQSPECLDGGFCDFPEFSAQCAADPSCFGFADWISENMSAFANMFQVGGALGTIYGIWGGMYAHGWTWATLTNAQVAVLAGEAFLATGVLFGAVIIGYLGFQIGTVLYNEYGAIVWIRYGP